MNDEQLLAPPAKKSRVRVILAVAVAVVIVGGLATVATIALLHNSTLNSQLAAANDRAANAEKAAQAAAQKDYAARNAALDQRAATLNQQSQVIATQIGEIKANTIKADGLYVVGHDIQSGSWHTAGDGKVSGGLCRFVTISNAKAANSPPGPIYFDGPWTVSLSGVYGFQISGPCTWVRVPS
jgi:cell division protein FtsB